MKTRTLDQVKSMQAKAVRFAEDVLQDDDKADELASLDPEEYAERKHIQIVPDPTRRNGSMATKTRKTGLQATIDEQQDTLEQIGEIVSDALDPASTRAELVEALQQIDSLVNGEDEEDGDEGED